MKKISLYISNFLSICIYFLIAYLPFHGVLSALAVDKFNFPSYILLFKELVFALILVLSVILYLFKFTKSHFKLSLIPLLFLVLVFFGLISSFFGLSGKLNLNEIVLGFRVELFWLSFIAFSGIILKDSDLKISIIKIVWIVSFVFLTIISFFSLSLGIENFQKLLGSSGGFGVKSEVLLQTPLCHVISEEGGCRLTAGFSTPNNLAGYLIISCLFFVYCFFSSNMYLDKVKYFVLIFLALLQMYFTYSRFVLISFFAILLVIGFNYLYNLLLKSRLKFEKVYKLVFCLILLIPVLIFPLFENLVFTDSLNFLPKAITRAGSSQGHWKQTNIAYDMIKNKNTDLMFVGYGLGQSGPIGKIQYQGDASKLINDNLNLVSKYNTPWYELAVPENWYLQLVLNGGFIYFIIYLFILLFPIKNFIKFKEKLIDSNNLNPRYFLFLAILGIFIANLYLHIWENFTVSYYFGMVYLLLELTNLGRNVINESKYE
jgi:hypothetical protein